MKVKIIEVGPRDGLQNEKQTVPTKVKVELINRLAETGIQVIETTSFVSPKWIPQLVDANDVYSEIKKAPEVSYPVLTPNMNGLERALKVGVREIAIFAAVSESFSRRNINCSIAESFERFEPMVKLAREKGVRIRGYLSCVLGCPFEGPIDPKKVAELTKRLVDMGCYEVSLGDTIGVGTPGSMQVLLDEVLKVVPPEKVAIHCHDTYGQALPNILTAVRNGITAFDSSIAGLGGCPFAPGATGNVSTEDLVYMLHGMGIDTGIDMEKLLAVGAYISDALQRPTQSRVAKALHAKRAKL